MLITVNGKAIEISDGLSVPDLMKARKLQGNGFIIVLNGDVITPGKSENIRLSPSDNVDIIQIIEGG